MKRTEKRTLLVTNPKTDHIENCNLSIYPSRLAGNELTSVSAAVFANNSNLHVLNLAHNQLKAVAPEAFKRLDNLRALRLDNNQIKVTV